MVSWDSFGKAPNLENNHIHVWLGNPDLSNGRAQLYASILSSVEKERSERFLRATDRHFYIIGRGMLRRLLALYLDRDAEALVLEVNPNGKPFLAPGQLGEGIHFNISHSKGVILLAFSRETELGVDVEFIHRARDYTAVASRYLPSEELRVLESLAEAERREYFYKCWVKKEAFLKLAGEGVFTAAGREEELKEGAFIYPLDTPPDYVAALACTLKDPQILYYRIH